MREFKDLTGMTFNKLTVIKRVQRDEAKKVLWEVECECGNHSVVESYALSHGKIKSCGCLRKESAHNTHFKDLTNKQFGRLIVLNRIENRGKHTMWECLCECGNKTNVSSSDLINGNTKSCGCLKFESRNSTHGLSNTRLHGIWNKMRYRCFDKKDPAYKWYGERGIQVCEEWKHDFMNFYTWAMQNGYEDTLSIERIDVNGDYEPQNCKWIPLKEQPLNTRNTKFLTYKNETKTVSEWCEITGLKKSTLLNRIRSGFTAEECIENPIHKKRPQYNK